MDCDDRPPPAIIDDSPSPFVADWVPRVAAELPRGSAALDLAMGRGRHTLLLARAGLRAFGVDARFDAVRAARARADREGLTVRGWCADLRTIRLPEDRFGLVLVTRYLQRDLFPAIQRAVAPGSGRGGGFVIYETFTVAQRGHGTGPASPAHLLEPGELAARFPGFQIEHYEEVAAPQAVARLVARRQ